MKISKGIRIMRCLIFMSFVDRVWAQQIQHFDCCNSPYPPQVCQSFKDPCLDPNYFPCGKPSSCSRSYSDSVPATKVYVRLGAGASLMPTLHTQDTSGNQVILSNTTFKPGVDADLALGYRFTSHFRTELAAGYLYNSLSNNYSSSSNNNASGGRSRAYSAFLNAYYDFNVFSVCRPLSPYLGLGAGYIKQKYVWEFPKNITYGAYPHTAGFQGIAGIAYPLGRQWKIMLDYHYIMSLQQEATVHNLTGTGPDGQTNLQFATNLINLGISYQF